MTSSHRHKTHAYEIRPTWGRRCHKLMFFSNATDTKLLPININASDIMKRNNALVLDYIIENYIYEYDWFLKVDDKTYIIIENLLHLTSNHSTFEPIYFGQPFRTKEGLSYLNADSGILLSKEALARFGKRPQDCLNGSEPEDEEFGKCMRGLGVRIMDSRDEEKRTRFHCFSAGHHVLGVYPDWYRDQDVYGANQVSEVFLTLEITWENVFNLLGIIVPADDLAPLGSRSSASIEIKKSGLVFMRYQYLEG